MNKDRSGSGSARRSWFSRIQQAFTRVPSDTEQLLEMLRAAQQKGLFTTDALAMFEGVLHVGDMQVRDILIPRSQVVMLERDASPDDLLRTIVESGHSRFPVIGDSRDEVVGILLAKDFLLYAFERPVFVIDAYTRRLFSRLGLFTGTESYDAMRMAIESALGADVALFNEYHALTVRHAREVCRVRPRCNDCVLLGRCPAGTGLAAE